MAEVPFDPDAFLKQENERAAFAAASPGVAPAPVASAPAPVPATPGPVAPAPNFSSVPPASVAPAPAAFPAPAYQPPVAAAPVASAPVAPAPAYQPPAAGMGMPGPAPAYAAPAPGYAVPAPVAAAPAGYPPAPAAPAGYPPASGFGAPAAGQELSVKHVKMGEIESKFPVSRFKSIDNFTCRIGILDGENPIAAKTHWMKGFGEFYCWGGTCCDYEDPKIRYVFPVVHYTTNPKGEPLNYEFTIKYLPLPENQYEALDLLSRSTPLNSIDLFVITEDAGYQKNSYVNAGPAFWRSDPRFAQAVWDQYQKVEKIIERAYAKWLGRTVQECEAFYMSIKDGSFRGGQGGGQAPTQQVQKFDLGSMVRHPGAGAPRR